MSMDDQLARIYDQLESIQAQLRSLTATIAANNTPFVGQIAKLETEFEAHRAQDDERHGAINANIENNSKRISDLEKLHEQAKGAALLWRVGTAIAATGVGALEFWRSRGH